VARYHGVITWGGEWKAPTVDGMHFEITDGASVPRSTPSPPPSARHPRARAGPRARPCRAGAGGFTGPDLTGRGTGLRGDVGNNGPRVAALQAFLRDRYPLYAKSLAADGWWGPATTAAIAEFGHRSNIPSADGRNIGPKLAAALYAAGFDRTAAQARALAHIRRNPR
jgi:hypothetical protein